MAGVSVTIPSVEMVPVVLIFVHLVVSEQIYVALHLVELEFVGGLHDFGLESEFRGPRIDRHEVASRLRSNILVLFFC